MLYKYSFFLDRFYITYNIMYYGSIRDEGADSNILTHKGGKRWEHLVLNEFWRLKIWLGAEILNCFLWPQNKTESLFSRTDPSHLIYIMDGFKETGSSSSRPNPLVLSLCVPPDWEITQLDIW